MLKDNKFNTLGKKKILGEKIVSTGLLGSYEDIIIDNIKSPDRILGMSDGKGDFIRNLNKDQKTRINKIKSFLKNEN